MHATYLYVVNTLLKIDHKVVQEWANVVFTPNHTVLLTPNHTVVQGCDNAVHMYVYTKPITVTYTV